MLEEAGRRIQATHRGVAALLYVAAAYSAAKQKRPGPRRTLAPLSPLAYMFVQMTRLVYLVASQIRETRILAVERLTVSGSSREDLTRLDAPGYSPMRVLDIAGPDEHSQTVIGTSRGSPSELDIALSEGVIFSPPPPPPPTPPPPPHPPPLSPQSPHLFYNSHLLTHLLLSPLHLSSSLSHTHSLHLYPSLSLHSLYSTHLISTTYFTPPLTPLTLLFTTSPPQPPLTINKHRQFIYLPSYSPHYPIQTLSPITHPTRPPTHPPTLLALSPPPPDKRRGGMHNGRRTI